MLSKSDVMHSHKYQHSYHAVLHSVSEKNDTDIAHFNPHQLIWVILAEMLLREYTIKRWFVISLLLTNVSALTGETWTSEMVFSVMLYCMS